MELTSGSSFDHAGGAAGVLQRVFADHAATDPGKPFCVLDGRSASYGSIDATANQVARALLDRGIGRGSAVAVAMRNRVEFFTAQFGLQRAGAMFIPCSTLQTPDELLHQLDHAGVRAIFVDAGGLEVLQAIRDRCPALELCVLCDGPAVAGTIAFEELIAGQPIDAPVLDEPVSPADTAMVMYTSGTTSRPKGVVFTHGNLFTAAETVARLFGWSGADRFLHQLPLYHLNGGVLALAPAIYAGATLVMVEPFSASRFGELLHRHEITLTNLNSTHVRMILNQPETEYDRGHGMRRALLGLTLEPHEIERFEERFGVRLCPTYGLTEAGLCCATGPTGLRKPGSAGRPLRGYRFTLVDEAGAVVPVGAEGEIVVSSPEAHGLTAGYFRDEEQTRLAYRDDGFHTGDVGRFDADGYLWFVERRKDMIKRSGFNVAPPEVERVLVAVEGVADAAVVGTPDMMREEAIVAYVVREPGATVSERALFAACDEQLPDYKVPQFIEFLDELPRSILGKLERQPLRKRALDYRIDTYERTPVGHHVYAEEQA